jgi:hypothetical protein
MKHFLPIKTFLKLNMIVDFVKPPPPQISHFETPHQDKKKWVFGTSSFVPSPCSNLETMASRLGNT